MIKLIVRLFTRSRFKNSDGYIVSADIFGRKKLEHRDVAERILRRKLRWDEVVHHINGNRINNDPENLCVMIDHAHSHYHKWYRWMSANVDVPSREKQLEKLRNLNGIPLEDIDTIKLKKV